MSQKSLSFFRMRNLGTYCFQTFLKPSFLSGRSDRTEESVADEKTKSMISGQFDT